MVKYEGGREGGEDASRTFRGLFGVGRVGRLGEEELHTLHGTAGGVVLHFLKRRKGRREGGTKGRM